MADTITIQTSSSTDVVKIIERGPQGPTGPQGPAGEGGGGDLTSPGPIGSVAPNTGAFTTLSATGVATLPHIHGSLAGNLYIHVKNTSGGQLTRGTPVYIVGNVGSTDRVEVAAADFDDATKMPAVGLLEQTLANNGTGDAVIVGELTSANTGSYSLNQELFVGNNGALTSTRPTSGEVQSVGTVSRVHASTGVIVVNMQGRRSPNEAFAQASHTHAASAITSGVLDFDRIQQVVELESSGATSVSPDQFDLGNYVVGGNLHALALVQSAISEAFTSIILPELAPSAVGKVTVRCVLFEDPSASFVQVVLPDDTAIFPASGYTEMDPDEEFTFRWNNGRWDLDLRPNPSATTAVSIFKPNASGTLALTSDFAAPPAIGNTTPAAGSFTTLTANNGTVSTNAPALSIGQTWSGSAANRVFTIDVSGGSSSTSAAFAEFLQGGSSKFRFLASGVLSVTTDGGFAAGVAGFTTSNGGGITLNNTVSLATVSSGILEQRLGGNPQEFRLYNVFGSTTAYHRLSIKSKTVTLSGLTGASVATTGGFIPDGAVLVGLTTKVSTAITGATGYDIGDGSDADRWGANIGTALNTSSDNTNWTAGTIECFTAAQEVTLTAVGSNFTGGAVVIVAHYLAGEAD